MNKRKLKDAGKDLLGVAHRAGLKVGLFVLPKHYYVPIADQAQLRRTQREWARRSSLHGIKMSAPEQLRYLEAHVGPYASEVRGNAVYREGQAKGFGPGYGPIEAQCLHGMVRSLKPRRIIEVGSGVSTFCSLHATALNARDGIDCEITCIEPYPSEFIRTSDRVQLIRSPVERVDPATFDALEAGDLLFIDSTHALKPQGDVEFIYLEVIPRLKPGVMIHIHDIYLPFTYQRDILTSLFQWTETVLLQALLTNNSRLSVVLSMALLHYDEPAGLHRIFPDYQRQADRDGLAPPDSPGHFPSAIYLMTS
ncbi:MAG TPA: class I SAM-dependent methyltransferase [Allosphingosinicella sp.]|nr:class I SAM-dependent methyltransferase [Allosphingosinicella sp.]